MTDTTITPADGVEAIDQRHAFFQDLNAAVAGLEADDTADELLAMRDRLKVYADRIAEARKTVDQVIIAHIKAHGEIRIGTRKLYVGQRKTTKCVDNAIAYNALLAALNGDDEAVIKHLKSDAFKPGSCRKVLADFDYDRAFQTRVDETVTEGVLLEVDTEFVR